MTTPTCKEQYALYRLLGYGDGEAADRAGYTSNAPKAARRLYETAKKVRRNAPMAQRRGELEREITRLEFQLKQKERKLKGARVVKRFNERAGKA